MLSSHYFLSDLDWIKTRFLQKFKYTCVAVNCNWIALGSPTGSIHLFNLDEEKSPVVISIPSVSTKIRSLSFSPNGNYLLVIEENNISIIENPKSKSASLFLEIDVKGKEITCFYWLSDPPTKLLERSVVFLYLGDKEGNIWAISHNASVIAATVQSSVFQIAQGSVNKQVIINAANSAYFMNEKFVVQQIRAKQRPHGDFGGIYVEEFDAICFARPEGKLLLATPKGKPKVKLMLFEAGRPQDIPEQLDLNLSYLQICGPFLISTGKTSVPMVINLKDGKLDKCIFDPQNTLFIDCSVSYDTVIFLWQDKITKMKVCASDDEYMEILYQRKEYDVLQKFCIENNFKDLEKLKSFIDPNKENQEFNQYIEKIQLSLEPQPLKILDPSLYDALMQLEIPTDDIMERIHSMLKDLVIDEKTKEKIEIYILNKPQKWVYWTKYLDYDKLVEILNEKEETAVYAMQMAKCGQSPLSKILSQIETLPIDFCIANSPPIHNYNLSGSRRQEFEEFLKINDIFSVPRNEEIKESNKNDVLDESPFSTRVNELKDQEISPEEAYKLLLLDEWENQLVELVNELHKQAEAYYLSEEAKDIPIWVKDVLSGGRVLQQNSGCGNWGATTPLKECPICGMPMSEETDPTGAALFPCSHCFHNSCLKSRRYCPVCYNLSMK